jgi:hypothetical protein
MSLLFSRKTIALLRYYLDGILSLTTNRHCTLLRQPDSLLGRLLVPQATADHLLDRQCLSLAACLVCLHLEVRLGWERRHLVSRLLWRIRLLISKGDGRELGISWTRHVPSYMCI